MRRREVTGEQWALIEPLLPPQQGKGRRTHLRRHENVLKRLLAYAAGFN